ncbi:MAG: hypothetical protein JXD19_03920 [Deltaproteobacteria bacterium]|nr:hypothetical protein [Deltaproteobacteria bacterium]
MDNKSVDTSGAKDTEMPFGSVEMHSFRGAFLFWHHEKYVIEERIDHCKVN